MEINNRAILIILVAITLLLFPVAIYTSGALRIILGLPVVIFIPGYLLLSALFPNKNDLGGVERVAFSIGLSIAIAIIIGAILNFTPWGISLYPILISAAVFAVITTAVAWYRSLQSYEEFYITLNINLYRWQETAGLDKLLFISLAVAVLVALGSIGYVVAVPKHEQMFTEFYLLSSDGRAENYPKQAVLGEAVEITVGIVNHEGMVLSYTVAIKGDGIEDSQVSTGELASGDKWQELVSFIPRSSGAEQKVEFWLYIAGEAEPYLEEPLYLYLDVTGPS